MHATQGDEKDEGVLEKVRELRSQRILDWGSRCTLTNSMRQNFALNLDEQVEVAASTKWR